MRISFRGIVLLGLTLLLDASSSRGALLPQLFVPRNGLYQYNSSSSMLTVQLFSTDSDETLRTASAVVTPPATTLGQIAIENFGFAPASSSLRLADGSHIPFTGTAITDNAPDMDAFAIGISDGTSLLAFFQMRMAGSAATVSDTSLASIAVSAGLWTNVNAYFEFPAQHAGIALISPGVQPTGPSSYFSFIIPEPASLALLGALAAAAGMTRRRTRAHRSFRVRAASLLFCAAGPVDQELFGGAVS